MRENKFRAWHTEQKKMYSAEELGEDQLTLSVNGRGFINVHSANTKLSIFATAMIPLEYTGLKDKNGKEIYEGDILEPNNREVCFGVYDNEFNMGNGWYTLCHNPSYPLIAASFGPKQAAGSEVIGNIYENPGKEGGQGG